MQFSDCLSSSLKSISNGSGHHSLSFYHFIFFEIGMGSDFQMLPYVYTQMHSMETALQSLTKVKILEYFI
jgi:hypothetical protein